MEPKLRIFFAEFPFLRDEFGEMLITRACVSRVDRALLSACVVDRYDFFSRGLSHIAFFQKDGGFIERREFFLLPCFGSTTLRFESLLSGFVANLAHYVAWYRWDAEGTKTLTLYKPPKKHATIVSWLDELEAAEKARLRAEIAEIDEGVAS